MAKIGGCQRARGANRWIIPLLIPALALLAPLFTGTPAKAQTYETPKNFSRLAEEISPAVVNIRTVKTAKGTGRVFRQFRNPFGGGETDPFQDFFDRFFGGEGGPQRDFKQRSLGSGFIIDSQGHIVTNNHVIEDADEIQVKLPDGHEYDAKIIGRDPSTDLALIKVEAKADLPAVRMGDSDKLEVGQWVLAIGSPFGLEHTVTAGIVSAKGRVIGSGPYDDFIQTDASINPGNSGGPLLNMAGEVVGINTAIIASGQGIGFAVPINMARSVVEQLKDHGEVTRGWLGVAIQDLSEEMVEYYGLDADQGVLVTEVFPGDPADKAGIQPRDIILTVNGKKVESTRDLTRLIAGIGVGDKAEIELMRDGRVRTVTVRVAKREEEGLTERRSPAETRDALGVRVADITQEMARQHNIADTEGVIVVAVEQGGKAHQAGLLEGDVIKEINHQAIAGTQAYAEVIDKVGKGEAINMFIRRPSMGFLVVRMEK